MRRVLICEDEDDIRDFVVINLRRYEYEPVDVSSGEDAIRVFDENNGRFDIAILDAMLPGVDGFEVCKQLRARSGTLGIIMLTAKAQEMDKVRGFMLGADDYVTKPFSPSELVARIDAIYRRVSMTETKRFNDDEVVSGEFTLNTQSRTLKKNGEYIDLTQIEFQIVDFFFKNTGAALNRSEILQHVWGTDYFGDVKIVDVNIRRLRVKMEEDPSHPKHIITVWGFGYKWIP
ncbi:MAG: response regulator transcription factor [Oscillospiraceae bacterium]|jgi:DNA-binding response OmpR family regulator|nr:response regulator transcription factor [Oscillospiraceae bacterium]